MGQSLEAFLQWKLLVSLLLGCTEAVRIHQSLCLYVARKIFLSTDISICNRDLDNTTHPLSLLFLVISVDTNMLSDKS